MGGFIDMAAVLSPRDRVIQYLATTKGDGAATSFPSAIDRTFVMYEEATGDFERIRKLSEALGVFAFALHIHDGDLWLYEFY